MCRSALCMQTAHYHEVLRSVMWQREAERADVTGQTVTPRRTGSFTDMLAAGQTDRRTVRHMTDIDNHHDQLQKDVQFLCSDQRMGADLVDKLVLQLNRIYPQILSDKEAHRFRNISIPTKVRLAELLKHLSGKGEEACDEFYRGLHIHAEDIYASLPTRVIQREMAEPQWTYNLEIYPERHVLNDRGPMFFLSCLSLVVGVVMLYYYKESETLMCSGPFLHCSAATLSKDVLIFCADVRKQKK